MFGAYRPTFVAYGLGVCKRSHALFNFPLSFHFGVAPGHATARKSQQSRKQLPQGQNEFRVTELPFDTAAAVRQSWIGVALPRT